MKKFYLLFIGILLLGASLFAQAPQKFNYQAVARDATGNLIADQNVSFRISILQGSSGGTLVYQETHTKTTNIYGQTTLSIGAGTVVSGTFGSITWGNNSYYIKTEMDPAGGSAYSFMGSTQLLSVPYALYSNTTGGGYVAGTGINIAGTTISNTFPDQTVTLSPGSGIGTTGSYPNFTVSNLLPNATHTGDATGDAALSVVKLQGKAVSATIPTENQVLQWVGSQWAPSTLNIPVAGWSLTGNSGTHDGIDFIGTTDPAPITFKVDNKLSGKIDQYNASLGYQALIANFLGTSNTALGVNALFGNTAGSSNTGIGYAALSSNKSNSRSTAIGYNSMFNADNRVPGRETFNTALGYEALKGSGVPANNTGQYNTAIGDRALFSNTTGFSNSATGQNSLYFNNVGYENTATGWSALYSNTSGNQNTANGTGSLYSNTSGYFNTAVGYVALYNNSTGNQNTAIGRNALSSNTTGSYNTASGFSALMSNKANSRSTAIGYNAMFNADDQTSGQETFNTALGYEALKGSVIPANNTGRYNTAVGDQALYSNTTGDQNTAIGWSALYLNTSGDQNTANGTGALYSNTSGYFNTAVGYTALYNNTIGTQNTAIGRMALSSNTTGSTNTASGFSALKSNKANSRSTAIGFNAMFNADDRTSGLETYNTAVGYEALKGSLTAAENTGRYNTAVGDQALYSNTSGSNNVASGRNALYLNSTGSYNTAIGDVALSANISGVFNTALGASAGALVNSGSENLLLGYLAGNNITSGSNNIVIGYNLATPSATADNQLVIGATDLFFGDMGTKLIGIGTSAPTQKLEIKDGNLLMSNSGTAAELRFTEPSASGINYTAFKAQAQSADLTYTLPGTAPTNGQVLSSASSGLLSWVSNSPDQTVVLNAGTGISTSGVYPNFLISNTLPDQTLVLTAGTGIGTSGTYPNFTLTNTLPNATHTGDATGNSILSVVKIQGRDVANTLPTAGQALKWNNASSRWEPTNEDNTTSVIKDANNDTKVQVEETANDDKIRFDIAGTERWVMTGARLEPKNTGYSVFIGDSAGYSDDFTNNYSIFIGYGAGRYNTSGYYNTANGTRALYSNTTGYRNTAYGMWALRYNTTSSQNTAIGSEALYTQSFNNGGTAWVSDNVAIGYAALYYNQPTATTNGIFNTATGNYALYANTTGFSNTAVGFSALRTNTTGNYNSAIGYRALNSNTTGYSNTASGHKSLYSNTTGRNNIAMGDSALYNNSTTSSNIAIGKKALFTQSYSGSTEPTNNVAVGYAALYSHQPINSFGSLYGKNNTATGNYALYHSTYGSENTATGYLALYSNTVGLNNTANGSGALFSLESGYDNTALGFESGYYGTNFNECTFIGSNSYLTTSRTNVTMLGHGIFDAQCTGDNQVLLGNTVVSQIRAVVTGITAYSDERFKTSIKNNVAGLDFILKLKPVTYNVSPKELHKIWGTPDSLVNKMDFSDAEKEVRIGFVAQDVEKAAKESGFDFPGIDVPRNDKEVYSLRYVDFIMPMVKGIQEQQVALDEQKALIQTQQQQIETLIKRIEQLENK